MNRTSTTHGPTNRLSRMTSHRPARPSRETARRQPLPRWGDLHPDHRIPTFLEAAFFEEEASATTTRLDRLS